ncbi:MAG: sensor histidine kinase [Lysobacteraceae bacterium]|nr:MAG: sensor histidine kinase [Xanthomonadaceae bacterium]
MFTRLDHTRLLRYAGLFTWAVVGVPLLYLWLGPGDDRQGFWQGWMAYGAFGFSYAWLTRKLGSRHPNTLDFILLAVLTLAAIGVSYYSDSGLGCVLLMVAASVLPWLLSLRLGVAWLIFSQLAVVPVFVQLNFPKFEAVMQSMLYAGFAGFVYATSLVARQQAQAREEQRRLNSELRATRALLAESVRINERTRISRELHDLLGHHLTALSLNLEVANHLASGKAQEHVSQAHTLAKLLLSDVREAVSQIRDSDAIDMAATLMPLAENVPGLQIDMRLPEPFLIDDAEHAHVLLRCTQEIVTNVVRHAQASRLELHYSWREGGVHLHASDDGRGADAPASGNGLRGMRERLAAYGGDLRIDTRTGGGFALEVILPTSPSGRPAGLEQREMSTDAAATDASAAEKQGREPGSRPAGVMV